MSDYIIEGGRKLEGEVEISGSKNAALPIIAATILNGGKTTLYNVPNIHDTQMMFEILRKLGGTVTKKPNKVIIDTSKIDKYEIPEGHGRKLALTLPEIKRVMSFQDSTNELEEFRDLWFFSYLCNGINFRDLLYLQYSNIINGEICFIRAKTARNTKHSKIIHAVITPEMQKIIEKWGNPPTSPETYIFPFATGKENPFERVKLVREVVTECNQILYKISHKTGIPRVTTYSARHSFATVLKRSGVNISYISESLGHSNLAITENYLASFEAEERKKNSILLTRFDL